MWISRKDQNNFTSLKVEENATMTWTNENILSLQLVKFTIIRDDLEGSSNRSFNDWLVADLASWWKQRNPIT